MKQHFGAFGPQDAARRQNCILPCLSAFNSFAKPGLDRDLWTALHSTDFLRGASSVASHRHCRMLDIRVTFRVTLPQSSRHPSEPTPLGDQR